MCLDRWMNEDMILYITGVIGHDIFNSTPVQFLLIPLGDNFREDDESGPKEDYVLQLYRTRGVPINWENRPTLSASHGIGRSGASSKRLTETETSSIGPSPTPLISADVPS